MNTKYEAIILCGGEAWGLKPDTYIPKPMLKLGTLTLLEYQIKWLMTNGIKHIILASNEEYNIRDALHEYVDWSIEPYKKGTGGAVMLAIDKIKNPKLPFYVMNVDDVCYSEDTEVLTPNGWKLIRDVMVGEEVMSFNKDTNTLQFEKTTSKINKPYNNRMVSIDTEHISLLVTPEHRMLLKPRNCRKPVVRGQYKNRESWVTKFAIETLTSSIINVPCGFKQKDKITEYPITDEQILLAAWIFTEGCYPKDDERIQITQSEIANKQNCEEIKILLNKMNISYGFNGIQFRIKTKDSIEIKKWLPDKVLIPRCWINNFSNRQLNLLFTEMQKGDGTKGRCLYTSYNDELLDQMQEIAVMLGYKTVKSKQYHTLQYQNKSFEQVRGEKRKLVDYSGNILCLQVPSHYLLVRRNGKTVISGNCFYNPVNLLFPETQARLLVSKPRVAYGVAKLRQDLVIGFKEKPYTDEYVSCGHYSFNECTVNTYFPDNGNLEDKVLPELADRRILENYRIQKWIAVNTVKDYMLLKDLV